MRHFNQRAEQMSRIQLVRVLFPPPQAAGHSGWVERSSRLRSSSAFRMPNKTGTQASSGPHTPIHVCLVDQPGISLKALLGCSHGSAQKSFSITVCGCSSKQPVGQLGKDGQLVEFQRIAIDYHIPAPGRPVVACCDVGTEEYGDI